MLNDQQILQCAQQVVNDVFFGSLTTIDAYGVPRSRYMGAVVMNHGLHTLYALTANHMRKSDHLRANAQVCWLFARPEYEEIVTLSGHGRTIAAPQIMQEVWSRLMVHAREYSMEVLSQQPNVEYEVIETVVATVELLCPRISASPLPTVVLHDQAKG